MFLTEHQSPDHPIQGTTTSIKLDYELIIITNYHIQLCISIPSGFQIIHLIHSMILFHLVTVASIIIPS